MYIIISKKELVYILIGYKPVLFLSIYIIFTIYINHSIFPYYIHIFFHYLCIQYLYSIPHQLYTLYIQAILLHQFRESCICQDWDKKNFIFFCTYSIKPLLIFKVQNSLLLLTFSLLPIEEASSFFTTGFLYYSFCLLHCISDKVLTLKHNLYVFVVVNEHLINYVRKYISVILLQHTILG